MEKLVNLLFSLIDIFDINTTDPVLSTQKRILRGIIISFLAMILAFLWVIATTPEDIKPPATSLLDLLYTIHKWLHIGGAILLIGLSLSTLLQIIRYVLVVKWPERFVDFSQSRRI